MDKSSLYFLKLIFILSSTALKSQETHCYYTEHEPISEGSLCYNDVLHFTSDVETLVRGELSANEVVIITASPNASITFKPKDTKCPDCVEGDNGGGTTIKSRGSGGGKTPKDKMTNPGNTSTKPVIKIKKNPAKNILEIYNPQNLVFVHYSIYDSFGKKILSSSSADNKSEIIVSHLPAGNYRIILTTKENKIFTLTFIKN